MTERFQLLPGAFVPWSRVGYRGLCPATHNGTMCNRRVRHGGRHASITVTGRVIDVWGDDVHAAARTLGRAPAYLREMFPQVFPSKGRAS